MAARMDNCRRRDADLVKLMMSDYEVVIPDESNRYNFFVKFRGPTETPYVDGVWKVHVTLPADYPFKSPSIGFSNRMYHPNVDEISGSVCLDVINQTWSPMFDLVNIFDVFLPQLLRYPNPADPLNGQAAAIMMRDTEAYTNRVKDYIRRYASVDFSLDGDDAMDVVDDRRTRARSSTVTSTTSTTSTASSASAADDDEEEEDSKLPAGLTTEDDGNESDVSELSDL